MKKNKNGLLSKRGFTLMELMIVMAITGIMLSVVLVNMQNSRKNSEIEAAGMQLVSLLREVQNNALTGKKIGSEEGEYSCAFQFKINANGSYEIARGLKKDGNDSCEGGYDIESSPYANGQLQQVRTTAQSIIFTVPHGERIGGSQIVLQHSADSNVKYSACISAGGNIEGIKGASCP